MNNAEIDVIPQIMNEDFVFTIPTHPEVFKGTKGFEEEVTGLHGAGYANIVFCSPNTKILELKPYSSGDVIKNLSKNSSLSYRDISIKPSINNLQNQSGQIIIPITELKDKINF